MKQAKKKARLDTLNNVGHMLHCPETLDNMAEDPLPTLGPWFHYVVYPPPLKQSMPVVPSGLSVPPPPSGDVMTVDDLLGTVMVDQDMDWDPGVEIVTVLETED